MSVAGHAPPDNVALSLLMPECVCVCVGVGVGGGGTWVYSRRKSEVWSGIVCLVKGVCGCVVGMCVCVCS